jgi:hypothetical protein
MFDPRIYRAALLPAVAAFVLLMFSLEPIPSVLQPPVSAPTFDGSEAGRVTRNILRLAPEREPGSEGDRLTGDFVSDRFSEIEGGEVSTQSFDSSYNGDDVELRNVLLTLPGSSEKTLLIVAHRDSADGPGASSSAAATASLITLAEGLGGSRHSRTIVLASTDGGSDGAQGARELADSLPNSEQVESAIVISQPGAAEPKPPFVISTSAGVDSPSTQLIRTAQAIASKRFEQRDDSPGPWSGLSHLAFPAGLGEQAALRDEGLEAIALGTAGEREIPASAPDAQEASAETLQSSGTIALDLILTLDEAERQPTAGPDEYIRLGDNLIPGWTLVLLAITLLIPPLLAAADTWLREYRNDWRTRRSALWAAERILPPLAALLLAYALGLIGLIPDPRFPYDPARFPVGIEAPIAVLAIAAAFVLAGLLISPTRTPLDVEPHTLAAAGGILSGGGLVGLWLLDPYLALLLSPVAHVWLLPARAAGPPRIGIMLLVGLLALLPATVAFLTVAASIDLGGATPWHLLLMIVDGQIGLLTCLLWCVMLGGLIACVSAAGGRRGSLPYEERGLGGTGAHAGPGALGATPSSLTRH